MTHLGFKSGCGAEKRGGGPCGGGAVHTAMHSDGGAVCVCVCVCARASVSVYGRWCVCVIKVAASPVKASEETSRPVNSREKMTQLRPSLTERTRGIFSGRLCE